MPQHQQRRRNARENASPAVPGYMRSTLNSSARVRATFEHFNIQGQASGEAARPARRVRPNRRSRRYRRKAVIVEDDNIEVQDEAKEAEEVANPPLPMVAPQHGEGEVKEGDEAMSSGQAANEDVIEAAKEHVEEVADLLVRTPTPNAGEHEEKQPVVVEDDNIEVQDEAKEAEEVANPPLPMAAPQHGEEEVEEDDEAMSDGQAANEDFIEAAKEHVEEVADLLVRTPTPNAGEHEEKQPVVVEDDNIEVQDEAEKEQAEEVANSPLPMVAPQLEEGEVKEGDEAMSDGQAANEDVIEAAKEHVEEVADLLVRMSTPNTGEHEEKQPVIVEDDNIEVQDEISAIDETTADESEVYKVAVSEEPNLSTSSTGAAESFSDSSHTRLVSANSSGRKENFADAQNASTPRRGSSLSRFEVESMSAPTPRTTGISQPLALQDSGSTSKLPLDCSAKAQDSAVVPLQDIETFSNGLTPGQIIYIPIMQTPKQQDAVPLDTTQAKQLTRRMHTYCHGEKPKAGRAYCFESSYGLLSKRPISPRAPVMHRIGNEESLPSEPMNMDEQASHSPCASARTPPTPSGSSYGYHRSVEVDELYLNNAHKNQQTSRSFFAGGRTPQIPCGAPPGTPPLPRRAPPTPPRTPPRTPPGFGAANRGYQNEPCRVPPPPGFEAASRGYDETPCRTPPTPFDFEAASRGYDETPCRTPPTPFDFEAPSRVCEEASCRTPSTPSDFTDQLPAGEDVDELHMSKEDLDELCFSQEDLDKLGISEEDLDDLCFPQDDMENLHIPKDNLGEMCFSQEDLDELGISEEDLDDLCFPREDMNDLDMPKDNLGGMCFSQKNLDMLGISEEDLDDLCFQQEDLGDLSVSQDDLDDLHAVAESTAKEGPVESRLKLSDLATSGSSDVTSICTSEATAYSIDLQAAHAILDLFPYEEEEEEEEIDLGMSEAQSNVDFQRDSVRILAGSGASAKGAPSRVLSPASSLRQARALGDFEYEPPQPMPFTAHQRSERTVPIPEQRSASERLFSKATLGMRLSPHQPQASKTDRAEEDHRSFLTPMRPIHSSPKVSPLLSCEDNSPMPQPSCLRAQTMEEPRSAARVTADEAKLTAIEPEECEWIQLSVPNLPIKAIRSVSRAERSPLPLDELLEEINESFRKMDLRDAAKRDAREEGRSEPLFFASRDRSNQDHKVKT